jgi:hypothetical protein
MHIEDLIERLAGSGNFIFTTPIPLSSFDDKIIHSFSHQIMTGNAFTKKQRELALKLVNKYKKSLKQELSIDIESILKAPSFRMPERTISSAKQISINLDSQGIKTIFVKFPYDNALVEMIKDFRKRSINIERSLIAWNSEQRVWEFGLSEGNILFLSSFLDHGFVADEQFIEFLNEIKIIVGNIEGYVPMLVRTGDQFTFVNLPSNVHNETYSNLTEALLSARRRGVSCWDDQVNSVLKSQYKESVINFFENKSEEQRNNSLADFQEIIKYSKNVLFVIPGGHELKILRPVHQLLKTIQNDFDNISVLFRLDSGLGTVFNDYVKENSLNQPLTNDTKYIFVSGKLPKTIVESNKYFDLVFQFGLNSAHYGLKKFVKLHQNVIVIDSVGETQEFKFG